MRFIPPLGTMNLITELSQITPEDGSIQLGCVSSTLLVAPKLQHPFRKSIVSIGCGKMIPNNFVTATSPHDVSKNWKNFHQASSQNVWYFLEFTMPIAFFRLDSEMFEVVPFPIGSMGPGIFTYMKTMKINHKCRSIYQSQDPYYGFDRDIDHPQLSSKWPKKCQSSRSTPHHGAPPRWLAEVKANGSPKNPYRKNNGPVPQEENDLTTVGDIPNSSKNVMRSCNTSIINENFRKVFQYWRIQSCKLKYKES